MEHRNCKKIIYSGLEFYDYLESDGNSWIDTNYYPIPSKVIFEFKFNSLKADDGAALCGSREANKITENSSVVWVCFTNYWSNVTYPTIRCDAMNKSTGTYIQMKGTNCVQTLYVNVPEKYMLLNGTKYSGTGSKTTTRNTAPFLLFSMSNKDIYVTSPLPNFTGRIYTFKIWEDNKCIRYLRPCTYKGVPGMWDSIENKFYGNSGTGTFKLGNKIKDHYTINKTICNKLPSGYTELEYLESTGTLYIDTGIIPSNTKIFKHTIQWLETINNSFMGSNGNLIFGTRENKWNACGIQNFGSIDLTTKYNLELYYNSNKIRCFKLDGIEYVGSAGQRNQSNYWLFWAYGYSYCKMRIYNTFIYDGTELIRNFVPCTYNGEVGMYDLVEGKFYLNKGTGNFIGGPGIKQNIIKKILINDGN